MKARLWILLLFAALGLLAAMVLLTAPAGGRRSVTDRTPRGYRAAFAYLEATGGEIGTWDAPFDALDAPLGTTLVTAWPVSRGFDGSGDAASLVTWVRNGGRTVLLLDLSAEDGHPYTLVEGTLKGLLVRDEPIAPWSWEEWRTWSAMRRTATMRMPDGPSGTLALADPLWNLTCPANAEFLATDASGVPSVCRLAWGKGEIVLVSDATVWQNDHLGRADNLALLDGLLAGRTVRFDEWHHGVATVVSAVPPYVPGLFAVHLGVLWLVSLLALARRFGDPLPPPGLAGPSMARALHALATLHEGSGHAGSAAARLYALARARSDRKGLDPALLPPPPSAPSDTRFAAWAARIGAAQRDQRF
ncbi:MAG: DUF4350 domain-containing protein [Pseudomonadota bacterium]|nr:DUF4350 domain-containing protein [Pseudomonadota bacterium]